MASLALVIGALGAMRVLERSPRLPPVDLTTLRPDCRVALVVVGVDPASFISRAVDRVTGRGGYSHVYIDTCRELDGRPVVIDYTMRRGVHYGDPSAYASRPRLRIELDPLTAAQVEGCARARIGSRFELYPMALRSSAATCVGLVVSCLPPWMRAELETMRKGPCISPNTVAAWARARARSAA
jgi:hypothetical protein